MYNVETFHLVILELVLFSFRTVQSSTHLYTGSGIVFYSLVDAKEDFLLKQSEYRVKKLPWENETKRNLIYRCVRLPTPAY